MAYILRFYLEIHLLSLTQSLITRSLSLIVSKYSHNVIVKFTSYVIGNNGMLVISTLYIYIGATTAKIVTLFKDDNSDLKKNEIYFIIAGGIVLLTFICLIVTLTNREIKKYVKDPSKPKERHSDQYYPSDFQKVALT